MPIPIVSFSSGYQLKAKTPTQSRSQPARVSADRPVHFIPPYVGSLSSPQCSPFKEKESLFQRFIDNQQPTFAEVFQVLNALNLEFRLSPMPTAA